MPEVELRGTRLHYQRLGPENGVARVVFVHGLVMDNLASWYFTAANAVAAFADVIVYDLRGHGRSPLAPSGYGVDDMVQDLDALLQHVFGDRSVCVVGNSFGALVAVSLAVRAPSRVSGLVLVDGHLGDDDFGARMASTLSLRGEAADRAIAEGFREWLGRHSERKRTKLGDRARALVESTTLVDDLRRTAPLGPADFARVEAPTLALYGERSDVVARSAPLLAQMPRCTLEIVPGCTHSLLWEATDLVRDRIVSFCRDRAHAGAAADATRPEEGRAGA